MKNYWLDRWTDPIISRVNDAYLKFNGKYYVVRQLKSEIEEHKYWEWDGGQIASGTFPDTYYLHSDGTWYRSNLKNGKWTGYYDTREEAIKVLSKIGLCGHWLPLD